MEETVCKEIETFTSEWNELASGKCLRFEMTYKRIDGCYLCEPSFSENEIKRVLRSINTPSCTREMFQWKHDAVTSQVMILYQRYIITISMLLLDWHQNAEAVLEIYVKSYRDKWFRWRERRARERVGIHLNLSVCFCHALFQVKLW